MKKIFTILFAAVLAVGAYANEQAVMADTIKAVRAVEMSQYPGVAQIMWMADSTKSAYYYVEIGQYDTTSYKQTIIGYIAAKAAACTVQGYAGVFMCDTYSLLTYGVNYPYLINKGYTEAQAAGYKPGWENFVNAEDLTLKPSFYYAVVVGYDANLQAVTEVLNYNFFTIADTEEGVVNIFESKKPVKFIENGEVRILRDGKVYNMSGALVR